MIRNTNLNLVVLLRYTLLALHRILTSDAPTNKIARSITTSWFYGPFAVIKVPTIILLVCFLLWNTYTRAAQAVGLVGCSPTTFRNQGA